MARYFETSDCNKWLIQMINARLILNDGQTTETIQDYGVRVFFTWATLAATVMTSYVLMGRNKGTTRNTHKLMAVWALVQLPVALTTYKLYKYEPSSDLSSRDDFHSLKTAEIASYQFQIMGLITLVWHIV